MSHGSYEARNTNEIVSCEEREIIERIGKARTYEAVQKQIKKSGICPEQTGRLMFLAELKREGLID